MRHVLDIRRQRAMLLRGMYVILDEGPALLELARAVLDAGITVVQYRAKGGIAPNSVRALRALTSECNSLLIVNDDWRAAIEFDCDGVHLGPGDEGFDRVASVREALDERLIGLSCATLDEMKITHSGDVDYVGVGPVYATHSKIDAGAPIGIETLGVLVAASSAPVAAIGGINAARIPQIRKTGAAMAAVISAIADASDPAYAARELVAAWHR